MTPGGRGSDAAGVSVLHVQRPLFTERPIERHFDLQRNLLEAEVQHHIDPANLLRIDLNEIVSYLVEKYSIKCPILGLEDAFMEDSMAPVDEPTSWREAYERREDLQRRRRAIHCIYRIQVILSFSCVFQVQSRGVVPYHVLWSAHTNS